MLRSRWALVALLLMTPALAGDAVSVRRTDSGPPPTGCAPHGRYARAVTDTPGLVGYWRLGETSGEAACDSTGGTTGSYRPGADLGHPGLLVDDENRSISLDGVRGHVTIRSSQPSGKDGKFSAEAWVRPASIQNDQTVVRRDGQYLLRLLGRKVVLRVWWDDGSFTELTSTPVMEPATPQHLVATFDGSAMRLFRNGGMVASKTVAKARQSTDSPLLVGGSDGYDYFAGQMDDVAEYGVALGPTDVLRHYVAGSGDEAAEQRTSTARAATEAADRTLLAAGDIAGCDTTGDELTAAILDREPGTVLTLGDNVYVDGTAHEFAECFAPSWGRQLWRTRPAVGDHEYRTPGATGYYEYFAAAAGDPSRGYYSFDQAGWHIVVLNTNCGAIGGCQAGSPQEQWLRQDLAAHPALCTAAVVSTPRFSSGTKHGSTSVMQPFWQALYDAGVEVVLSGDDHLYERFAPQTPRGAADPAKGIRQFIVGTGGRGLYPFGTPLPNSEVRDNETFGVLRLDLRPSGYGWSFLPVEGRTFADSGSGECH